jgi:hypothetical protein
MSPERSEPRPPPPCAQAFDQRDGGLVEERDAVPQYVAFVATQEQRALRDGEVRHAADADQVRLMLAETIAIAARQRFVCRPGLAGRRHELARLVADRAARRLCRGGRELRAAGDADESRHGEPKINGAALGCQRRARLRSRLASA